jgi:hypothetical protein
VNAEPGPDRRAAARDPGRVRRRELLTRVAVAGGAALLPSLVLAPAASAGGNPDVALIERLVRFELAAAVIYDALAELRLDAATWDLLAMLSQHERDHAAVLLNAAEYLGGAPQKPPSLESLQRKSPAVAGARTRHDALVLAGEIEGAQLHGYFDAQQQLSDTKLLQQTATVMCSEGQHAVLVRTAIGVDPIPSPFELGAV